jgi:quercetin dioxygenase-like cupin family protein
MKLFKQEDFVGLENPVPQEPFRPEILTHKDNAKDLGGIFGLLPPRSQVPYHYHEKRESVIMAISGEATEIVEGEKFPFKAGWVFFIPAGERHMTVNHSDKDFRYLEFFTCPPTTSDFVKVDLPNHVPPSER